MNDVPLWVYVATPFAVVSYAWALYTPADVLRLLKKKWKKENREDASDFAMVLFVLYFPFLLWLASLTFRSAGPDYSTGVSMIFLFMSFIATPYAYIRMFMSYSKERAKKRSYRLSLCLLGLWGIWALWSACLITKNLNLPYFFTQVVF